MGTERREGTQLAERMKSQLQGGPGTEAIQTREGHFRGRKTSQRVHLAEPQSDDGAREGWEGLAQAPHAAGGARPTLQLFGNGRGERRRKEGRQGEKEDLRPWCWSGRDVTRA